MLEPELCGIVMDLWRRLVGCAKMREVWSVWLTPSSTLVLDVSLRVMPVFGRNEIAKHKRQSTTGHGSIPHLTFSLLTFCGTLAFNNRRTATTI